MTDTLTKIVVDCATGEVAELPLTADEIAEREAIAAKAEADRLAAEQAEQDRAKALASAEAKLFQLGLSASEIEALLGK